MSTTEREERTRGFTIIEVVLVLAIAGLIFLMVFIALPALQRSQRDSQRRTDVGTFVSQLSQFSTNNNGSLPTEAKLDSFKTGYLKWKADETGEFKDPQTGEGYVIEYGVAEPQEHGMVYGGPGTKCNGETIEAEPTNRRQAGVAAYLEGGGAFCQTVQQ